MTAFLIELENLREIAAGDESFIIGVLSLFVSKEGEYAQMVKDAIAGENLEDLRQAIHKIKSSVSVIGMNEFRNKLNSFEKKLIKNQLSIFEAKTEAKELLEDFYKAEEAVRALLSQMNPNA